jgi:UDPglucose--hexose-1-phosphate uridylyltransferase
VLVAAHRNTRPWVGSTVQPPQTRPPVHVPDCYLCPGNVRAHGDRNPAYTGPFVFDNDFPSVGPTAPIDLPATRPPYRRQPARGRARVICYGPRHDLPLAEMDVPDIADVVRTWQRETHDQGTLPGVNHLLLFENKGEIVGVSNAHPHAQLYATNFVWKTIETELRAQRRYQAETGRALFADILAAEEDEAVRVLYADGHTLAFVPFFARYAYEVYVAPRRRVPHVHALSEAETESLARALREVTVRFDNLWRRPFPYVMTLHQAPTDGGDYGDFHFFAGYLPPLRQPNLVKFLAGPEIGGGNFLSDTAPEEKAAELRAQSTVHYSQTAAA